MKKVFVDTSAWISYSLSKQPKHLTVKRVFKQFIKNRVIICTSSDVVDETVTRLLYDAGVKEANKFIYLFKNSITSNSLIQLWIDEEIQSTAFNLVEKYSEHKLSLTDATTIALVKKHNIESVISLDSDFRKVGISTLPASGSR